MPGIIGDKVTIQPAFTVSVQRSGSDEIFRRFVRADGARCGAGDQPAGVCRVRSTTANDVVTVDTDGIALVEAGAAIALTEGSKAVMPDASGRAIVAVGSVPYAGLALDAAAAAGDVIRVWLNRGSPVLL